MAGGNCKTKADAEYDAASWIETTEGSRAKRDGRIAKGDVVKIKPEWQDKGDDKYEFFAIETQLEGMNDIRIRAVNNATGEASIGIQSIQIKMIERS